MSKAERLEKAIQAYVGGMGIAAAADTGHVEKGTLIRVLRAANLHRTPPRGALVKQVMSEKETEWVMTAPAREVAKKYGVHTTTVWAFRRRKTGGENAVETK